MENLRARKEYKRKAKFINNSKKIIKTRIRHWGEHTPRITQSDTQKSTELGNGWVNMAYADPGLKNARPFMTDELFSWEDANKKKYTRIDY